MWPRFPRVEKTLPLKNSSQNHGTDMPSGAIRKHKRFETLRIRNLGRFVGGGSRCFPPVSAACPCYCTREKVRRTRERVIFVGLLQRFHQTPSDIWSTPALPEEPWCFLRAGMPISTTRALGIRELEAETTQHWPQMQHNTHTGPPRAKALSLSLSHCPRPNGFLFRSFNHVPRLSKL